MNKKQYSAPEVANILGVSRITVFNRIRSGKIKAEKIGRNYIISYDDLLEALGKSIGKQKREDIEKALDEASKQYREVFKKLSEE